MKRVVAIAVGLAVVLFGLRACCPIESTTRAADFSYLTITVANSWVVRFLNWCPGVGLVLMLAVSVRLLRSKRVLYGLCALGAGIGAFLVSWGFFIMGNLSPWTTCDTVAGPDGQTYSFMDSSFWQGQTMAITRRAEQTRFVRLESVIGTNNGDSPRSWATLVRPTGSSEEYGQLFCTKSGWIAGMRFQERCFLAYHLPSQRFYGHNDVEELSPFLLLEGDAEPNPGDISRLIERLASCQSPGPGCPDRIVLEAGLVHPNPRVQRLARKLLEVSSSQPTTGRVRSSPASQPSHAAQTD